MTVKQALISGKLNMAVSQTGILYLPGEDEHVTLDPDPEYFEKARRVMLSYERLVQTGSVSN